MLFCTLTNTLTLGSMKHFKSSKQQHTTSFTKINSLWMNAVQPFSRISTQLQSFNSKTGRITEHHNEQTESIIKFTLQTISDIEKPKWLPLTKNVTNRKNRRESEISSHSCKIFKLAEFSKIIFSTIWLRQIIFSSLRPSGGYLGKGRIQGSGYRYCSVSYGIFLNTRFWASTSIFKE